MRSRLHQTHDPLAPTMNPILTPPGMDARAAVDVAVLLEDLLNQGRNSGIFSHVCIWLAVFAGIIAALGDVQSIAEQLNGILLTLLRDKLIPYARLREKMPIAFFKTSRSCRKSSFSRCNRRFSSSSGGRCPLPGNASFPCSAKRRHQWQSVLSGTPRSRAICACDFPLVCYRCTASSLNSFVYVGFTFCIVLPFSGKAFSSHFTPSISQGQDQEEQGNRLARGTRLCLRHQISLVCLQQGSIHSIFKQDIDMLVDSLFAWAIEFAGLLLTCY